MGGAGTGAPPARGPGRSVRRFAANQPSARRRPAPPPRQGEDAEEEESASPRAQSEALGGLVEKLNLTAPLERVKASLEKQGVEVGTVSDYLGEVPKLPQLLNILVGGGWQGRRGGKGREGGVVAAGEGAAGGEGRPRRGAAGGCEARSRGVAR